MRRSTLLAACLCSAALSACAVKEAETAAEARSDMVGVSEADLSFCAGPPTKTERLDDRTELRAYEYKASDANAVSVSVPVFGGGVSVGAGGNCEATFKVVDGRVAALRYSGDSDRGPGGTDAVCAPIVSHCLRDLPPRTVPPG